MMKPAARFLLSLLLACTIADVLGQSPGTQADRPNFVFILADDLGVMDVRAYNPDTFYETPHLNRLAADGVLFTNGYAASPVSSPTRFSIMTGRYPSRVDATDEFSGSRSARFAPAPLNDRIPRSEVTLAEALKLGGYRTAFLGKWHLGPSEEYWPLAQGFDVNVGGHERGSPRSHFSPYDNPELLDGPDGEYLPDRLVDEALGILDAFQGDPFLVFLSFYSVHAPLQAPQTLVEKYERKASALPALADEFADEEQVWPVDEPRRVRTRQSHATYAAMVDAMDANIGRLLAKLTELGIQDDTVVFFTSDNGGLSTAEGSPTSNGPLRGGKGWVYEGGIREPYIIKWPGVAKPGSTNHTSVSSLDFFPTMLEMAGVSSPSDAFVDGVSLVPELMGGGLGQSRNLFWHYPHYSDQGGFPAGAVRDGQYKLIERLEDGRVHLYDLDGDVGETNDLTSDMPALVDRLREQLHSWYAAVDAKFLDALPGGPAPWRP